MDKEPTECPKCKASLDAGDVREELQKRYPAWTEEELLGAAKNFGWTPTNKVRFGRQIGIYSRRLDRTVEYACPDCGHHWPRSSDG